MKCFVLPHILTTVLFLSFYFLPAAAQSPSLENKKTISDLASEEFSALRSKVKKFKLSNGLRVLFYQRDFAPIFTGQIWVKLGGVDEVPGQTGLAHFLEHMAFKGSDTIGTKSYRKEKPLLNKLEGLMNFEVDPSDESAGKKLLKKIEDVQGELEGIWKPNDFSKRYKLRGATGLNAATSKDYTVYMVNLPSSAFDFWLWMESDRLLNPVFRQFYKEREVIQEERRSRVDNNPSGKLYEALLATAYWTHPNRLPIIGWPSDMANLSAVDMRKFYKKYYRADNMVIVLVGDLRGQDVEGKLERYFGRMESAEGPRPKLRIKEEPQVGERVSVVYDEANPQLFMAWHKPAWPNPDDSKFAVLHSVLADGRSSIFHKELVQEKRIALGAYSTEAPGERYPSLFVVGATPAQGVTNETLRDEIQKILNRLGDDLVSESDVAAAKRRVRVGLLGALDSNNGIARMLGKAEVLWDDWEMVFESYDQILATTPEDLRDLVRKYLSPDVRTYTHLETKKSN